MAWYLTSLAKDRHSEDSVGTMDNPRRHPVKLTSPHGLNLRLDKPYSLP
jgi:hypothetical protein